MAYKSDNNDETMKVVFAFIGIFIGLVFGVAACVHDTNEIKKHGKQMYEYVIIEKYDNIGSSWHLIGGRASETEYHIVYKMRCINRPDDEHISAWKTYDDDVNYLTYRHYETGKTYKSERAFLPTIY